MNVSLREQERPPGRLPGELETMETRAATIAHKNTHTHTPLAVNTARGEGQEGEHGEMEKKRRSAMGEKADLFTRTVT